MHIVLDYLRALPAVRSPVLHRSRPLTSSGHHEVATVLHSRYRYVNLDIAAGDFVSIQKAFDHGSQAGLSSLLANAHRAEPFVFADPKRERRTKLWDIAPMFHCSIIGTCLTAGELRRFFVRMRESDARTASDHALHSRGVRTAGQRDVVGKLLHKTLDARHETTVKRFAKVDNSAAITALWRDSFEQGNIPGAYWAVLTHPASDRALIEDVFGEVHMLSHLVGSANRVDLARLANLQDQLGRQAEKVLRQEVRLQTAAQDRSVLRRRIDQLETQGLRGKASEGAKVKLDDTAEIAGLVQKLGDEKLHAAALADRLRRTEDRLHAAEQRETCLGEQADAYKAEIAALERALDAVEQDRVAGDKSACELGGRTLLYVGGRPKLVEQLRAFTTRRGGLLLAHDGGIEDSTVLLPGLISQATIAFFPVDCVSHVAAGKVKKHCRDRRIPFVALRSASLASFVAAVERAISSPPPQVPYPRIHAQPPAGGRGSA